MTDIGSDPEHMYEVGVSYITGTGRPQNSEEGAKYISMAAEKGYLPAIRDLGVLYLSGNGVERDYRRAYDNLKKAADDLDPNAMYHLALMYENGLGVEKDLYEALRLMGFAAGSNFSGAIQDAQRIEDIIDEERRKKLNSRPVLNLEVSDVDVEECCCKKMLDAVLAKDYYVVDTYQGPMLVSEDEEGYETPITECPFCHKKAVRVQRDKQY
ncbi:Sel1 repeat protein [Thermoplasmatales archaeon BRNA1]|nr:Sel1 repeat protein [Thermoplasmatales archaeon BRNA1]